MGLGEGIKDGAPVGRRVGLSVGSHVVHVKAKNVWRPPDVNPMSYIVHVSLSNGGVLLQLSLTEP